MSCVHYKFSSKLTYDTVTFDGLHISVWHLKKQIMGREKLKAARSDLQITNAQTKEEYTDGNALIPKNSSVIVRRIPVGGVKSTSRTYLGRRTEPGLGTTKAIEDACASISLAQLTKTANLAEANASEEDKIKAMMLQSGHEYDPVNYVKKTLVGPPPPSYTCFRCGKPGHYIKNCPTNGDKNFESAPRIKKSTGIPTSFMMEVKDPTMKGAVLTKAGKYAIPTIDAEAYAIGKKEKPPFLPEDPSPSSEADNPLPEELLCLICKDILTDAAVIPCCGNSYCDDCIRTALLESDEHTCPTCHQNEVSPDTLVANKCLRQVVNNFKNETGYPKRRRKQLPPPPLAPPRPLIQQNLQPLRRPPISRQQDPLMVPVISSSGPPSPSGSSFPSNPSSSAPSVPGNPSSAPAPGPDRTATVSTSGHSEKSDGPFRDSDHQLLPAAAQNIQHTSEDSTGASSTAIPALVEEKGCQVPVLGTPSLLGQSLSRGQLIPTTGPVRINAAGPGGGRPGREHPNKLGNLVSPAQRSSRGERSCCRGINRGRHHGEGSQRTPGPSPAATPVSVPVPPPPLYGPPPQRLPLPPGAPPAQFSPQFPPGQPPPAGYSVPPPGFWPAPATLASPWVSPGVQTAHSNTIPTTQAPPLSREEFSREQRRLKEESSSPYSGSSSSWRSSYPSSKSRSGSSPRSGSYSRSFSRSHSRSYLRLPPYPRRGRGKRRNDRSRSRSHGYHRSRSRSPPSRRCHSPSRSPQAFRGQSPTKRNGPQGESEREYAHRYREGPRPYDLQAYYGQRVDFRDPFEQERYREWERQYLEWYEKYSKGDAAGAQPRASANREDFSPERLLPLKIRNSPFTRGHREDSAAGQSHRNRNLGGNSPEKLSTRDSHNGKENPTSKDKESEKVPGDGKGNKPKKPRTGRKGEESESFLNPELPETSGKSRESSGTDETKTDTLCVLPSRDDATHVRDEPMDAEAITFKSVSEKDKREKEKPKVKSDKTKRKRDGSATAKKDNVFKPPKGPQEKVDRDREKSLPCSEPPLKKAKEEATTIDSVKPCSSSQKEEKVTGTPR